MMTIAQGITKAFTDQGIAEKYVTVRLEEFLVTNSWRKYMSLKS